MAATNKSKRIFLNIKDLQDLTGLTYNACQKQMSLLKASLSKERHQKVTIREYCKYEGITEAEVRETLGM